MEIKIKDENGEIHIFHNKQEAIDYCCEELGDCEKCPGKWDCTERLQYNP